MNAAFRVSRGGREALRRMALAAFGRWLQRESSRHLADGCPPVAVYAFDLVGHQVNLRGRYERDELDVVMQLIDRIDTRPRELCLDVGANIGNHALHFASHYQQVIAFEPQPRTFRLLQLNAELVANVQCRNLGLSDAAGHAFIDLPAGNAGMARVSQAGTGSRCELQTLDAVVGADSRRVSLIKIDVEGHEAQVLRGARQRLEHDQPVVLLEQAAHEFADGSSPAIDVLRSAGYTSFVTLEPTPDTGSRWLNLVSRLLSGDGFRAVWRERLPARFHSMIVAVPPALAAAAAARASEAA
jgi:FkbM family methyltransferase